MALERVSSLVSHRERTWWILALEVSKKFDVVLLFSLTDVNLCFGSGPHGKLLSFVFCHDCVLLLEEHKKHFKQLKVVLYPYSVYSLTLPNFECRYRGYYMATQRYEMSLRVLKHEKRNFISPSGHVIFYLLYKHQ